LFTIIPYYFWNSGSRTFHFSTSNSSLELMTLPTRSSIVSESSAAWLRETSCRRIAIWFCWFSMTLSNFVKTLIWKASTQNILLYYYINFLTLNYVSSERRIIGVDGIPNNNCIYIAILKATFWRKPLILSADITVPAMPHRPF